MTRSSDPAPARRLLLVSYFHPPYPGAGTRWPAMIRHLRRLGYSVTVVASSAWGVLPDDGTSHVLRVGDLRAAPLLRGMLRRGKLRVAGDVDHVDRPPQAVLTKVLVPDMNVVTWLPGMLRAVRRELARNTFDCLVTTSPPESSHLVGLALGANRPPWVADFRDGWSFEPLREPFPTAAQRRLDGWLEQRVLDAAEIAVGTTRPIASDLESRAGAKAAWVPNGWDPEVAPASWERSRYDAGRRTDAITLVHTGTLSGTWGRSPEAILRALAAVSREPGSRAIRFVHAGPLTTRERELVAAAGVSAHFEHLGTLERSDALALQRTADALVLLTSRNTSEATSKLFEYLAARRPIIAVAENNEAARIIHETNTGIALPHDDVGAIVEALRKIASGELKRAYVPRNVERYVYPRPAEAMAELIEDAIRRRTYEVRRK